MDAAEAKVLVDFSRELDPDVAAQAVGKIRVEHLLSESSDECALAGYRVRPSANRRIRCRHAYLYETSKTMSDVLADMQGSPLNAEDTAMEWHQTPKDDAWKQAHLAMLTNLNMRLMLRCDACAHATVEDPRLFAARHNLDLLTPMLTVSKRMRCTKCGAHKGRATPEPSNGRPRE